MLDSGKTRPVKAGRALLRLGRAGADRTFVSVFSWVLSFLAVLSLGLGISVIYIAGSAYEFRQAVWEQRGIPTTDDPDKAAGRYWMSREFINDRKVHVYLFDIHNPDEIEPPVGVSAWPEKGTSVVSPAMFQILKESSDPDRFGDVVAEISPEGLASPSELVVYASVSLEGAEAWLLGAGADEMSDWLDGEIAYDRDVDEFYSLAIILLITPGIVALFSGARAANDSVRLRQQLLDRFGASFRQRWLLQLPYAAPGPIVASALLTVLIILASRFKFRVPGTNQIVDPTWVGAVMWPLIAWAIFLALAGVSISAGVGAWRRAKTSASRLVREREVQSARGPLIMGIALVCYPWIMFALPTGSALAPMVMVVMIILLILFLPKCVAYLFRLRADSAVEKAWMRGDVGALIGWRLTEYRSAAIARLLAAVIAMVVIAGSMNMIQLLFAGPATEALRARAITQDSVLTVQAPLEELPDLHAFADANGLALLVGVVNLETHEAWVDGAISNEALDIFGIQKRQHEAGSKSTLVPITNTGRVVLNALSLFGEPVNWYHDRDLTQGDLTDSELLSVFIADKSGNLDSWVLNGRLTAELSPLVSSSSINEDWIVGARDLQDKSRWVTTLAVPGVIVLAFVGALIWTLMVMAETRSLTSNPYLRGASHTFKSIARIRLLLPFIAGGVIGAALTLWLLLPLSLRNDVPLPIYFLIASGSVVIAVGVIVFFAAVRHWGNKAVQLES